MRSRGGGIPINRNTHKIYSIFLLGTIGAGIWVGVFFSVRLLVASSLWQLLRECPCFRWLVEVSRVGPPLLGHRAYTCRCGSQLHLDKQMNELQLQKKAWQWQQQQQQQHDFHFYEFYFLLCLSFTSYHAQNIFNNENKTLLIEWETVTKWNLVICTAVDFKVTRCFWL